MTAYDQIQYPSYTHAQTHPDQLATKALLFGLTPAPVVRCRVLELGCGDGTNLASIAQSLPGSKFTGIDLAASAIAQGHEMAGALNLNNLSLRAISVMDVGPDFGQFDYIIAHGLYSWVPEEVRDKVLSICQTNLAPHGVAYVSYNANPGGHFKHMLREMMLHHTRAITDPTERVHQSIALIKFLAEAQTGPDAWQRFLRAELAMLLERDENNIFHDELGEVNSACTFHDFCEHARAHRLQYLAEADYVQMQDQNCTPAIREALRQLGRNRVAREQYLDFLSFRRFRQTLLCHAELSLRFGMTPAQLQAIHVSCAAKPVSVSPDLASDAPEKFMSEKDASMEPRLPIAKAAFSILAAISPAALPFPDLLAQSRARLGRAASPDIDAEALTLFEMCLQTYAPSLTTLHLAPPKFCSRVNERPVASPLARWQARSIDRIANLCHAPVVVEDAPARHLLTLLDGTRDLAAIHGAMRDFVSVSAANSDADGLIRQVDNTLALFARCALLIA